MSSKSNKLLLEAVSARAPKAFEVWTWKNRDVYLILEAVGEEYTLFGLCSGAVYDGYPLESFANNMGQDGFWQRIA